MITLGKIVILVDIFCENLGFTNLGGKRTRLVINDDFSP